MTRINTIDPQHLLDQHLMAEYREITRVSSLSKHTYQPKQYLMGTGHVKFFYDKGLFLSKRRKVLYDELVKRGYNVTWFEYVDHTASLHKDWQPVAADHAVSIGRLHEKLVDKPNFYTYYGKKVAITHYINVMELYR